MTYFRRVSAIWHDQRLRRIGICILGFGAVFLLAAIISDSGLRTDLTLRHMPPGTEHPFGTDWLGRDMLTRTLLGLRESLMTGLLAAGCSTCISLLLGLAGGLLGARTDKSISALIDVVMSTPHLVLLILIAFVLGGGPQGVVLAVALSHWPQLARIIRAEVLQLRTATYVLIARNLGHGPIWIATRHMLPHLAPQVAIGLTLLIPHAILHAAGLTFLGFGVAPHAPSIGMLLAESMRHISTGYWWLAVIPGLSLVLMIQIFEILGANLRTLFDPKTRQGA